MARVICMIAVVLCFAPRAFGQATETRNEFWPEVDVFVPLSAKVRLMFSGTITKLEETREDVEGQVGVSLDYLANEKLTFRAGYRYGFALAGDDPYKEHRIIFEQTVRKNLPLKVLLTDRNREDLRFVNGDFSVRYRNRLTFEREFKVIKLHVTPYVSGEVFYDSRFDTWNRNRLAAGIQIPLKRSFPVLNLVHPTRLMVLDLYIMRQNDSRSDPPRVRGFGVAFNIYL